ncbi:hypothetical protein Pmar_PMAR005194 [Perkinsus marinus ATCC 50983]|uniref:Transmembrane protein n=1 Tax=Perkinsus marinus (strain ATCC 50983 / TXsc) TaxID=423536 RepID=C5KAW2_PERM5|nr:hypothetical protein Pmar_PMAR005194 [Perkinsus marinus ATCC 50983]EER18288.1 hypothetical protein Pmar_PMAR005194 [Perkinsus marinus ATCC 50983]|eukprot:XP_002786492.1 hypothetical protein Pmar_PMAR005194 [Perkinsus marinus ATCC 50983]
MSPLRLPYPSWDPMASALAVLPQDVTGWTAFVAHVNDIFLPMIFHDGLVPPAELISICTGVRRASATFLVPGGVQALVVIIPDYSVDPLPTREDGQPQATAASVDSVTPADPFLAEYSSFQQMTSVERTIAAGTSRSRFPGFCKPCQLGLVLVAADDALTRPDTTDSLLFVLRSDNPTVSPTSPLDLSTEFTLDEVDVHEYSFRWWHSTNTSTGSAGLARMLWWPVRISLSNRRPNERVVTMSRVALQATVIVLLFMYATITAMQLTWYLGISPVVFVVQLMVPPLGDLLALTLGAVWVVLSYTPWARWFVCFVVATLVNSLTGLTIRFALASTGSSVVVLVTLTVEYLIVTAVKVCLCVTSNMLLAHHMNQSTAILRPSTPTTREPLDVPDSRSPPTQYIHFPTRDSRVSPPLRLNSRAAVSRSIVTEMRGTAERPF